ncbi:hypothetical protein ES708_27453 [subsurface metagenome]
MTVRIPGLPGRRDSKRPQVVLVEELKPLTPQPDQNLDIPATVGQQLLIRDRVEIHVELRDPDTLPELLEGGLPEVHIVQQREFVPLSLPDEHGARFGHHRVGRGPARVWRIEMPDLKERLRKQVERLREVQARAAEAGEEAQEEKTAAAGTSPASASAPTARPA